MLTYFVSEFCICAQSIFFVILIFSINVSIDRSSLWEFGFKEGTISFSKLFSRKSKSIFESNTFLTMKGFFSLLKYF